MGLGGRNPQRDVPFSSPMGAKNSKHFRTKSSSQAHGQILRELQKQAHITSGQFAILLADAKGNVQIVTSDAFQDHVTKWFPEHLRKEAGQIARGTAEEKAARRKHLNEMDRSGQPPPPPQHEDTGVVDYGEESGLNDDDGEDRWPDAEGEDEESETPMHPQQSLSSGHANLEHNQHSLDSAKAISARSGGTSLHQAPTSDQRRVARKSKRPFQADLEVSPGKRRKSSTKRAIPREASSSAESNEIVANEELEYKGLDISNSEDVFTFFNTRFRQMQQLVCKVVAKAWIKVIEPKKQSNFPYNRGDESKPSWWPPNARHKEPDHLMKPERLDLLLTMLRSRKVPVQKLEDATAEVMAQIPKEKAPLLEEIYRVAKQEERYINGQLPRGTLCFVAASEKIVKSPNQKVPSPKIDSESATSPINSSSPSGSLQTKVGRKMSVQQSPTQTHMTPAVSNPDLNIPGPRLNTGDLVVSNPLSRPPQSHNPFSSGRPQSNIQPLNSPLGYNGGYVPSPIQEEYLENSMPMSQYYGIISQQSAHRNSVPFSNQNPPHNALRRSHTTPAVSQQQSTNSVYSWHSPLPNAPMVGGMFPPPFSPNTQPHNSQHGNCHGTQGGPQSGSNPSTPIPGSSFQPMQLPPPPLPPMPHQPHQQPNLAPGPRHDISGEERGEQQFDQPTISNTMRGVNGPMPHPHHHSNISYSEFLESPELGTVAENSVTEDDVARDRATVKH
ncbi:hypothetical protein RUND412_006800 [Rhizina undulata]